MGVLSSLFTGVSGLAAQGEALGVTGDNIANANTTGFKASRAEFADIVAKNLKGVLGGNQIGRGVKLGMVSPVLLQGNIDATENATDLAIQGDGFFVCNGTDGTSFTRSGALHFDREGYLVTFDDQRLQGFQVDENSKLTSITGNIRIPKAITPAKGTKRVEIMANLDSRAEIGVPFDIKKANDTAQFATGIEMHDSQGTKRLVTFYFNKTADRQWEWHGVCDGKDIQGAKPGELVEVTSGKLGFTVDGKLDTVNENKRNYNFAGGAQPNQQIELYFGDAIKTLGGKGLGGSVQYGKESDILSWKQDGASAGVITNMSFSDSGVLSAQYNNGETKDIAQILLAKFDAPEKLYKVGNNRFKESRDSGTPAIGAPERAGRGKIFAKSLERSTVDLAMEFVNLIQGQRNFQANAKTISTTDEMLAEVLQLKR
ncbi:MAG: flagellar hook protein FlgE [Oligoflexia bacterium]|nr:flagellar hook protein FlgE [Oligoflexia bacterium]